MKILKKFYHWNCCYKGIERVEKQKGHLKIRNQWAAVASDWSLLSICCWCVGGEVIQLWLLLLQCTSHSVGGSPLRSRAHNPVADAFNATCDAARSKSISFSLSPFFPSFLPGSWQGSFVCILKVKIHWEHTTVELEVITERQLSWPEFKVVTCLPLTVERTYCWI